MLLFLYLRSLELFFATNQNNRSGDHINDKSPRLCRKFSSPPPLSIPSRTSSPVRTRKLSLHSPITTKVGGLDLSPLSNSGNHNTSQSAANSPTSAHTPLTPTPQTPTPTTSSPPLPPPPPLPSSTSPPPNNSKQLQDQVPPIPSSPDQSPGLTTEGEEVPRVDPFCGKLRKSIRRGSVHTDTRKNV